MANLQEDDDIIKKIEKEIGFEENQLFEEEIGGWSDKYESTQQKVKPKDSKSFDVKADKSKNIKNGVENTIKNNALTFLGGASIISTLTFAVLAILNIAGIAGPLAVGISVGICLAFNFGRVAYDRYIPDDIIPPVLNGKENNEKSYNSQIKDINGKNVDMHQHLKEQGKEEKNNSLNSYDKKESSIQTLKKDELVV